MKKQILSLLFCLVTVSTPYFLESKEAGEESTLSNTPAKEVDLTTNDDKRNITIGIVSFANCIQESKYGKREQSTLKALQNQITSLVKDTEQQLQEIASKLNDPEYIDTLSPEGEQELKIKFQNHQEDLMRYQQQYSEFINQANYKVMQTMFFHVKNAAKVVSEKLNLDYVLDENSVICNNAGIEVTNQVIQELDMLFEKEESEKSKAAPVPTTINKE